MPSAAAGAPLQPINDHLRRYLGALSEIEYSRQYGTTLNLGLQIAPSESVGALLQGRIGARQRGVIGGVGFQWQNKLRLNVLGEHLQQARHFDAADETYWVSQDKFGLGLQYLPQTAPAKSVGVRYTHAHSDDKGLPSTALVTESSSLYEKYLLQNRFVSVTSQELHAETTFDVGRQGEFTVWGGPQRNRDNDGTHARTRLTGGARYTWYAEQGKLTLGAHTVADRTEASVSYETTLP